MSENEIAKIIVDCCYRIHKKFGPGLLESAYEKLLAHELHKSELKFEKQKSIPIKHDNIILETGFRADLIVENKVIIELKSVEELSSLHKKQLLTYLKITNLKLGLLINFNSELIKRGIIRIVNNL
jgi:GxxExxY protein